MPLCFQLLRVPVDALQRPNRRAHRDDFLVDVCGLHRVGIRAQQRRYAVVVDTQGIGCTAGRRTDLEVPVQASVL